MAKHARLHDWRNERQHPDLHGQLRAKMKLPVLILRLVPDASCIRCGQHGYVHDKARLCLACLNLAIKLYERDRSLKK
jgi:hypothetical protein